MSSGHGTRRNLLDVPSPGEVTQASQEPEKKVKTSRSNKVNDDTPALHTQGDESPGPGWGKEKGTPNKASLSNSFKMRAKSRRLSIDLNTSPGGSFNQKANLGNLSPSAGQPKLQKNRRFSQAVSQMIESNHAMKKGSLERADSRRNLLKMPKPLSVKEVVRFGDIACFSDLESGGLLCANSRLFDTVFVDAQKHFDTSLSVHMQEECCFVVLQKFQFSATKAFEKFLNMSNVAGVTATNWKSKISSSDPMYSELRNLRALIEVEQETNELESKRMMGEPVAYGSVVQLRHRISGKFLTQTKNRAEHDASAMEVSLMEGGMEGSWWKMLPADKLRSEGEWVQYSDKLHFENMKHRNSYITISSSVRKLGERGSLGRHDESTRGMRSALMPAVDCTVLHPSSKARYEVNASPFISSLQIVPFQISDMSQTHAGPGKRSKHRLHGLDTITLCHRDSEKVLAGDAAELSANWIPASVSRTKQELLRPSCLWKVQMRFLELGGDALPITGSEVLLQHVQSGMYLSSENGCGVLTADFNSPSCLWSFSSLRGMTAEDSFLSHGKMVWLKAVGNDNMPNERMSWLSLDLEDSSGPQTPSKSGSLSVFGNSSGTMSDAVMRQGAWLENDDLLEISIVDSDFCSSVEFIVQTKELFVSLIKAIKDAEPIPQDRSMYDKVQMVIGHPVHDMLKRNYNTIITCLNRLVCSCTDSADDDPFIRQGPPRPEMQDLLRQIGMIEAAMMLAETIFKDLGVPLSPVAKIPAIFQVVRRCYLLIERACTDNVINKKSMLPYVSTIESHLEVQVGAYFAMMVIFSDTRELIESVDKDHLRKIVEGIKHCKSDLWARFLVQTCHEGDQPIRKNQNLLTELILLEAPELVFKTHVSDDDVVLISEGEHISELSVKALVKQYPDEDKLFCTAGDDISPIRGAVCQLPRDLFRFHMTMLELLGWLVHGRNPWTSQVLAANASRFGLEYNQLVRIMNRRELPFTYRMRCCELIRRLYVDQDPHQIMTMLRSTRIWTKLFERDLAQSRTSSSGTVISDDSNHGKSSQPCRESPTRIVGSRRDSLAGSVERNIKDKSKTPLHVFRDKNFASLKVSVAELLYSIDEMNASHGRRNIFLLSLVDLVHELTKFGFYHKYVPTIQDMGLRFSEVRLVAANLLQCVDPRSDIKPSTSGEEIQELVEGRFKMSPMNMTIIEGKIKMLEQLHTFLRCGDSERIVEFKSFWEIMLDRVSSNPKHQVTSDREIPEDTARISWLYNPPWTENDIKALADKLFGEEYNILKESASQVYDPLAPSGGQIRRSSSRSVHGAAHHSKNSIVHGQEDEWSKIMLSLVQYPSHRLKELAFQGLIMQCRQQSHFMVAAFGLQIIYSPKLAAVFSDVADEVAIMRRNIKYIVGGKDCDDQGEAHSIWMDVLVKWSELCTVTLGCPREDVYEVQNVLSNLGAVDVVTSILKLPMVRHCNQGPGNLDQPVDAAQCRLFNAVYAFLEKVCDRHLQNQKKLLPWLDHFCSHLGIEGLNLEGALSALVRDNEEVVALKGRRWIKMFFEDVMAQYRCQRAEWLDGLHAVIRVGKKSIVEHQALAMVLFRRYENVAALFMKSNREWDRRIDILCGTTTDPEERAEELAYLEYSLAVIRLLSVCCEGKHPAAEVYAARYLSLGDTIKGVIKVNVRSNGDVEHGVEYCAALRVKTTYLTFLHDVYSQTNVTRLVEELQRLHNGVWSTSDFKSKGARRGKGMTLMKSLLKDIRTFVENVRRNLNVTCDSSGESEADGHDDDDDDGDGVKSGSTFGGRKYRVLTPKEMGVMREYIFTSVFRFLTFYFKEWYNSVRGQTSDDEAITGKIFLVVLKFHNMPLTLEDTSVFVDGLLVNGREKTTELLKVMGQKARVPQSGRASLGGFEAHGSLWFQYPSIRSSFPISSMDNMCLTSIRAGYRVLAETVAAQYYITQFKELSRTGVKKLALMFCNDGETDLGVSIADKGGSSRNPTYNELLVDILDLCNHDSTSTQVLTDVLRLIRGTMYFYEPHGPERGLTQKVLDSMWKRFINDDPMEKMFGPKEEILSWVQCKYDAMGCTEAALKLSAHPTPEVRTSAIRLLLTLLQTGNEQVQNAVHDYFLSTKDTRFFKAAHDTLSLCMESLKDFKKSLKSLKKGESRYPNLHGVALGTNQTAVENESGQFDRKSEVMLMLRLMQLMCEGQFRPMQDMMQKQPVDTASYDLLRKCIELVEAIQPLLNDSLSFNMGNLTVLFMQIVETISEAVQGPNHQNQKYILSRKFLAVVNRVFSTLMYSPIDASMKTVDGMGGSVNDLKCWLKTSLLNCCHAILEGVGDEKRSSRALEFFELRNFEVQMVSIGQLLELVELGIPTKSTVCGVMAQAPSTQQSRHRRSSFSITGEMLVRAKSFEMKKSKQSLNKKSFGKSQIDIISSTMHFSKGWQGALANELFATYFLLVVMAEHDESRAIADWLVTFQRDYPRLYGHLVDHSSYVELSREGEDSPTEKVYFRMDPKVIELTYNEEFKARTDAFIFDVPRENPQEKAKVFLQKSKQVLLMVSLLRGMTGSDFFGLRNFFVQRRDLVDSSARRIAVLITLCLLMFYGLPVDPNTGEILGSGKFYTVGHTEPWYKDECYAHAHKTSHPDTIGASVASMMDYSDLSLEFRLKLKSRWESQAEWESFPAGRTILVILAFLHVCATVLNSFIQISLDFPLLYRDYIEHEESDRKDTEDIDGALVGKSRARCNLPGLKKPLDAMPQVQSLQSGIIFSRQVRRLLFRSIRASWYLAFKLFISLLGFYNSPFFFPVYLLDYFCASIGHMVLQAVIVGGPNLFRSFVLSMIVIICFGFNSYAFFSQSVNVNQQLCHSPFQCVVKHVLDSLTGDLTTVIGDDFGNFANPAVAPWQDMWHTWRYCTVFVSLVFWVFLLLGIMQGQIIDAFAEMRDKDKNAKSDLSNNCFISSIDRHSFTDYPGEWDKRKDGKFAWNYLHYFCYLQQKDPEEYSGLENSVAEAYSRLSTEFLPIGKFYAGQRHDESSSRDHAMELLDNHVQETKRRLTVQEKAVQDIKSGLEENTRLLREMFSAFDTQTEMLQKIMDKTSALETDYTSPKGVTIEIPATNGSLARLNNASLTSSRRGSLILLPGSVAEHTEYR